MAAICLAAALSACASLQAVEPVIAPPQEFRGDLVVPVEFVAPALVGLRCAERGATFLGLPGFNSGACSDTVRVTMPDPCLTFASGPYATDLCDLLKGPTASPTAAAPDASTDYTPVAFVPRAAAPVAIEFVSPDRVKLRCRQRLHGVSLAHADAGCQTRALITLANPCEIEASGWYARTLCHELAHANGWSATHRGGTPVTRKPVLVAAASPQAHAMSGRASERAMIRLALARQASVQISALRFPGLDGDLKVALEDADTHSLAALASPAAPRFALVSSPTAPGFTGG
jgi:hypothetical protein